MCFRRCPDCRAYLDPDEICDCRYEPVQDKSEE